MWGSTESGPPYPHPTPNGHSQPLPNKLFAHRTEGGLPKEGGDKLMVLDVVNFGLFDGSTADHCWELGLVFNPKRLLTIWGPRSGEVSCSRRGATLLQSLPGWPWTDR